MSLRRAHLISLALIGLSLAISLALYSRLPDPVPTHWDINGQPNDWTAKPWGAILMPLIQVGIVGLLALLPALSPRGFSVAPFARAYAKLEVAIVCFLTLTNAVAMTTAAGVPIVNMSRFVFVGIGGLLVVLGNYFGKLTPNFFIGVRTPWTLTSREVWSRTHRLAGWLFVGGGVTLALAGLMRPILPLFMAVIAVIVIVPIVYSYAIYRRLDPAARGDQAAGGDSDDDGSD